MTNGEEGRLPSDPSLIAHGPSRSRPRVASRCLSQRPTDDGRYTRWILSAVPALVERVPYVWGHHLPEQFAGAAVDRQFGLQLGNPLRAVASSAFSALVVPGSWPVSIRC